MLGVLDALNDGEPEREAVPVMVGVLVELTLLDCDDEAGGTPVLDGDGERTEDCVGVVETVEVADCVGLATDAELEGVVTSETLACAAELTEGTTDADTLTDVEWELDVTEDNAGELEGLLGEEVVADIDEAATDDGVPEGVTATDTAGVTDSDTPVHNPYPD